MNKPSAIHTSSPSVPVFWRVLEAAYELETRLETALEAVGLSIAKAGLLKCLAQSDEPQALSDLASNTQCVRSNITQLMDRLEADGLVERVSDPDDRRIRRARLTPLDSRPITRPPRS